MKCDYCFYSDEAQKRANAMHGIMSEELLETIIKKAIFQADTVVSFTWQGGEPRDLYRGYQWKMRPWRKNVVPNWNNEGYTRQRENEEYEPRQLDYDTGLPMETAVRKKI